MKKRNLFKITIISFYILSSSYAMSDTYDKDGNLTSVRGMNPSEYREHLRGLIAKKENKEKENVKFFFENDRNIKITYQSHGTKYQRITSIEYSGEYAEKAIERYRK